MPGSVVIAGSLAQRPGQGGHTWALLQYLLGFARLGWDVLFLDRLEPEMCSNAAEPALGIDGAPNLEYFLRVMKAFGLESAYSLAWNGGERFVGLSRRDVLERVRGADLLLNVMGFLVDEEILGAARRRVFLDIDPGFGQMWRELGLADLFHGHDDHVTIAENIGRPGCEIPTCGLQWIVTRQPIVLSHWTPSPGGVNRPFSSIGAWRGPYDPVEYQGRTYGLRVHEFRRFAALPLLSGGRFEIALDIDRQDADDLELLRANGWSLIDPREVAGDPWAYRGYIRRSGAEFLVAKNMYVQTRSGWFSDRSICYLASGKPVLAQDTGLAPHYPLGEGLIAYSTLEEAVAGADRIAGEPQRHGRAARALAEEFFESGRVLTGLLDRLQAHGEDAAEGARGEGAVTGPMPEGSSA